MTGNILRVYIYKNYKGELYDIWTFLPYMKKGPRSKFGKVNCFDKRLEDAEKEEDFIIKLF